MKTSLLTDKIFPALFKAKQEFASVAKKSDNPFFKSKYSDLNTHLEVVEPVLAVHGLMLLQPGVSSDNGVSSVVQSVVVHAESGQWVASEMTLLVSKNTMQDAGSAITYARRYTLGALLSLKSEDDDGETAAGRGKSSPAIKPLVPAASPLEATVKKAVEEVTTARKSSFRKPTAPSTPATDSGGWEN